MAADSMSKFLQRLRRTLHPGDEADLSDGQLLEGFITQRDEAAFAVLVRRHGPMVWGVCRRVLRSHHDAEDAFQATFLVLVRKAASIASRELLASWLYGVAHRTALKAKAAAAKRQRKERQVAEMPEPEAVLQDRWHDLLPLLDQALSNLPDKYRAPIVLCDLEGKTRKEAARQLGCPEGTVAGRLARARSMLAKRLARHGAEISGASLAVMLSENAVSAGMPISVVSSTIKAATLIAAGQAATTGMVSAKVAALTESVLKAMLLTKLRTITLVLVVLGMAAFGGGLLTQQMAAGQQGQAEKSLAEGKKGDADNPKKETPIPKTSEEKSSMAWGKPKDGVRLGILQTRAGPGGKGGVQLSVALENVGKDDVVVNLGIMLGNGKKQLPTAVRLTLTDAANKTYILQLPQPGIAGRVDPFVVPLAAGCRYTLPCALNKYADADPANRGVPLTPGLYRAAAEFVGKGVTKEGTNGDMAGLALMNYWTGTVVSGEVSVTAVAQPSGGQGNDPKRDSDPVGALWSAYWRRQHKDVTPSALKIELAPDAKITRTRTALVLPVKITNHSSREIVTRLAHEWHGGEWPATDLYASVTPSKAKKAAPFAPVYLVGEDQRATEKTTIAPGKSVNIELRMDWPGTGSVKGKPLMEASASGTYKVRLLIVFEVKEGRQFVASGEKTVELPAE